MNMMRAKIKDIFKKETNRTSRGEKYNKIKNSLDGKTTDQTLQKKKVISELADIAKETIQTEEKKKKKKTKRKESLPGSITQY